ncbi:MAG: restriction endonuclease subunit S [Kiritimatiellales bacterium]|jgi:type I restriction enzyme S subunit
MAGEEIVQLRDVCVKIGSGATPRGGKEAYKGGATSLIRSQNIYNEGFHRDGLVYIDDDQSAELRNVEVKENDVLLNITGDSVARCCQVATDVLPARVNQHVAIIRPEPKALDARFLRYVLVSHEYQSRLLALASAGATRPALTKSMIEELEVPSPPLQEQKAIAAVLGTLDDKIELNRRMNATLEAMARALFQSWFVDFDPVRAKLDGRQPVGMDAKTASVFPEHLEDSPLGHIPKGWKAGTLIEGFNLTMGQSPPGDTYNEEGNGLPFYQGRTDFGFRFPKRRIYCTAPTRYAKPGDTLVSVRAPVGDINMANEECCIGRGVAAVRHKSGATSFTYHSMANLYPDFARFEAEGTVFGSINKDSFEKLRFVIPPDEIVAAYEFQASPLDEQIRILENQSRTLATLRDTLLPKLLSGELKIPEAEKMVENL